jgi:hypothetical protein
MGRFAALSLEVTMGVREDIKTAVFGKTDYPPRVKFYDHATRNPEKSLRDGRPRYDEKIYVMFKPTHPDLSVRDVVSRAMKESDKTEFALQWSEYEDRQVEISEFRPPLQAVPGMRISYFQELQGLEIFDCGALAEYEGDLGKISYLRDVAKRIMEVSSEARDLRERRAAVREIDARRTYSSNQMPGQSTQKETRQEKGEEETFRYSITV